MRQRVDDEWQSGALRGLAQCWLRDGCRRVDDEAAHWDGAPTKGHASSRWRQQFVDNQIVGSAGAHEEVHKPLLSSGFPVDQNS
jgi:hypothetical protein